jgi:hypothetical protein
VMNVTMRSDSPYGRVRSTRAGVASSRCTKVAVRLGMHHVERRRNLDKQGFGSY